MTKEILYNEEGKATVIKPAPIFKKKRDIFRFQGEKDISINLEHVTNMSIEGKRITFQFYSSATFVDLEDEESAKRALEQILSIWSFDAEE